MAATVECRDVMGRPAKMLVTVRGDELTVMVLPGESAVFSVGQLEELVLLRAAVTLGIYVPAVVVPALGDHLAAVADPDSDR